jgi:hypothetical protein
MPEIIEGIAFKGGSSNFKMLRSSTGGPYYKWGGLPIHPCWIHLSTLSNFAGPLQIIQRKRGW